MFSGYSRIEGNTSISSIDILNDDCMINIFQYLTIKEKVRAELVCRNWNQLLKMSWSSIKKFEISKILPYAYELIMEDEVDMSFRKKNTSYLINMLKRCGIYANNLKIEADFVDKLLFTNVINQIPQFFNNLTELNLIENDGLNLLTDENLSSLLQNNPNISIVHLVRVNVNGDCLLSLDKNRIKELHLEDCRFGSKGFFYAFLSILKNLNKLKIHDSVDEVNSMIDALVMTNFKNIVDIEIKLKNISFINNLSSFLSKQEKVRKIILINVTTDQELLENLPTESLEELGIEFELGLNQNLPGEFKLNLFSFLTKQKKVRRLKFKNVSITDKFNFLLQKFLKEIDIEYGWSNLNALAQENLPSLSSFLSSQSRICKLRLRNVILDENLVKSLPTEFLEEMELTSKDIESGEIVLKLSLLLSKQKKIRKLMIGSVKIDTELLKSLPADNLEELDLDYIACDNKIDLRTLRHLKKLKTLKISFDDLDDDYLEAIAESLNENIKTLKLYFNEYLSSAAQIPSFNNLKSLESLTLYSEDADEDKIDIDNILANLSECKNLKYLHIDNCKFTTTGLDVISSLPELNEIYVYSANNTDGEILNFIGKSKSLKELKLLRFPNLTNNIVMEASKAKVERGDSHVLKFFFWRCDQINYKDLKDAPLIDVGNLSFSV